MLPSHLLSSWWSMEPVHYWCVAACDVYTASARPRVLSYHSHKPSPHLTRPQISALEVSGQGKTTCFVGDTCSFIVSPELSSSSPPSAFRGISFEARLIGPSIINVQVHPAQQGSYRM